MFYPQAHDVSVRTMVWSHNDNWMVTGDHSGYVKYWQSNMNNVKMFQAHKEPIRGIRYYCHYSSNNIGQPVPEAYQWRILCWYLLAAGSVYRPVATYLLTIKYTLFILLLIYWYRKVSFKMPNIPIQKLARVIWRRSLERESYNKNVRVQILPLSYRFDPH